MNIQTLKMIEADDIIRSIADALQYISYFHAPDFIAHLAKAYETEASIPARNAMAQILASSRMAAIGHRPICQDTGGVVVFAKIGMQARINSERPLQELVDEAVRIAYAMDENPLRASIVEDPLFSRRNTRDNSPAVLHVEMVAGDNIEFKIAAKGGGSENKSRFAVLKPRDNVADWVVEQVEKMGAGWCPPGVMSIGVGGNAEKAMQMAKEALFEPLDMIELRQRGAQDPTEELRLELYERINNLGVGAQGLGGQTTVVDVKIATAPTHAASQPVAIIPQCAANRHVHVKLEPGKGAAKLPEPDLRIWPQIDIDGLREDAMPLDLDKADRQTLAGLKAGQTLLLSGEILTARDAAHKRIEDMLARGEELPVELRDRIIYYVGPVPAKKGEAVGPAGPTTATRMDGYSKMMVEDIGIAGAIGKAERGIETTEIFARNQTPYFIAVGGAAYLISKAIESGHIVAFEDLGMESIHALRIKDMPVTVAIDAEGNSLHVKGPAAWRK